MRYLALLRGINVGGNNIIKMADLKTAFEKLGFKDVVTYIQSGNVVFSASGKPAALETALEAALKKRFGYGGKIVVVALADLRVIVKEAPKGFGTQPTKFRYDVIFLKGPMTPAEAMKSIETREDVDAVSTGKHALYFSRLEKLRTKSCLPKLVSKPAYKWMTIRNWNTTTKLLALMEA